MQINMQVSPEAASESPHANVSFAAGPGTDAFRLPALRGINEVSSRFTESASSFARRLTNLVGTNVPIHMMAIIEKKHRNMNTKFHSMPGILKCIEMY
jgi:hypothetical protein